MEQLWNIDLRLNIHVIKWHRIFGTAGAARTDALCFFVVKQFPHLPKQQGQMPYFLSSRMPAVSSKFLKINF